MLQSEVEAEPHGPSEPRKLGVGRPGGAVGVADRPSAAARPPGDQEESSSADTAEDEVDATADKVSRYSRYSG